LAHYKGGAKMLVQRKKTLMSKFYLGPILRGLKITLKNMLFAPKITIQFPEQRRDYSDRFRGVHYIKASNGVENCTACMLCPTVCPAECIHIEAGERPDKEKYPVKFEIDLLRCCFCGMCEEACPKDAIKLSNIYEMSTTDRKVFDKAYLLDQRGSR
jgi:NADH-quinone oxidoreductase chain I